MRIHNDEHAPSVENILHKTVNLFFDKFFHSLLRAADLLHRKNISRSVHIVIYNLWYLFGIR